MSTHMPGFRSFFNFLHYFVLAKLATSQRKGYMFNMFLYYTRGLESGLSVMSQGDKDQ